MNALPNAQARAKMSKKQKKKREKITYVDDGRTVADMSFTRGADGGSSRESKAPAPASSWKEKLRTYFESVKVMILPMLITMALIGVAFLLLYLMISLA